MRLYPGFTRLPVLLHSEMRLHARVPIINLRFLNNVRWQDMVDRPIDARNVNRFTTSLFVHVPRPVCTTELLPCRPDGFHPMLPQVEADIRIHPPDTNAVRFLQRLAERHAPAFTALAVLLKVVCFMHDIDKVNKAAS